MEAVLLQSSNTDNHHHHHHQSIALNRNRYIQNPNIISRSSENFSPYPNIHGGGGGGGATFHSVPSYYSSVPIINQKQPPLLPLPIITKKPYASLPLIPIRPNNNYNNKPNLLPVSSSPIRKNNNRSSSTRDQPDHNLYSSKKKSKSSSVISPKKQMLPITVKGGGDVNFMISSIRLGPEPCDIPKQVSKVMKQQQPMAVKVMDIDEEFTGLIFALAPPPSSLPLPKFSMRPRLSCNAEAVGCGGIDNGATDNLCRMLRLR